MKKILQILILGMASLTNAQTPIRHFGFNNSLTDDSGTISFVRTDPNLVYSYSPDEAGNPNAAVDLSMVTLVAVIPNLPQGNRPVTIMVKVKSICYSGENPIFSYGTGGTTTGLGVSHIDNSFQPGFNYLNNQLNTYLFGGPAYNWPYQGVGIQNTDYNLITITYDGTALKTYLGASLLMTKNTALNTTGTNFYLNSILATTAGVSGNRVLIDDLKIYDIALTQQQILQNHIDPSINFNTGLLAFYDFESNLNSATGTHSLTALNGIDPNFYLGVEGTTTSKSAWFEGATAAYNTTLETAFNNAEYTIAYWERGMNTTTYNNYGTTYELFGSHYSRRDNMGFYKTGAYLDPLNNWMTEIIGDFLKSWIHKAFVFKYDSATNTTNMTQYQNGVVVNFTSISGQQTLHRFTNKFTIGSGTDSAGNFLGSKFGKVGLDKFFIYSKALTKKEINLIKDMHEGVFNISTLAINDFNTTQPLDIKLYPNPANDILNIQTVLDIQSIEIYNLQGQKVLTTDKNQVNVTSLSNGMYMIRVQTTDNKVATQKFIKE